MCCRDVPALMTREQLIEELVALRQRVAEQDAQLTRSHQAEVDQRWMKNSLPVLVATAGLDGYYREVNAAFERILGWSEQESFSRPFLEFVHPEDRAASVEVLARLKAGTPAVNFLNRNVCRDGSFRWINWTVIRVPDRDIIFGIGQDITEKKQITERRQGEAKVKAEQEALRRMVMASDNERRLVTFELHDGAAQQLMGAMMLFQSPALRKAWKSPEAEFDYRAAMDGLRRASAELRRVMSCLRTPVLEQFGVTAAIADVASQLRLAPGAPEIEYHHDVQFKRLEPTLENSLGRDCHPGVA